MLDARERFSATADLYDLYRPSYPTALIDWILATAGPGPRSVTADVGCGTGISSRLFAERGLDVVGIDPNEAMLARARAAGGARYVRGEAAATGLASASVDLVTVAQAFHWFDLGPTLAEFARILKAGGWCAVFWNARTAEPAFMAEYDALLRARSREYAVLESHERTFERLEAASRAAEVRKAEFPNVQRLDEAAFLGRVFSSSYVVHGVADRPAFERDLRVLFERHARDGAVAFVYRSVGLCFRIR